jgi:hypothetical protein
MRQLGFSLVFYHLLLLKAQASFKLNWLDIESSGSDLFICENSTERFATLECIHPDPFKDSKYLPVEASWMENGTRLFPDSTFTSIAVNSTVTRLQIDTANTPSRFRNVIWYYECFLVLRDDVQRMDRSNPIAVRGIPPEPSVTIETTATEATISFSGNERCFTVIYNLSLSRINDQSSLDNVATEKSSYIFKELGQSTTYMVEVKAVLLKNMSVSSPGSLKNFTTKSHEISHV